MARAKTRLPATADILGLVDERGLLVIRATPNARASEVKLPDPGTPPILVVRTTATPEDGKANEAILDLLAEALGRPKSALRLVRGATGRDKVIQVG